MIFRSLALKVWIGILAVLFLSGCSSRSPKDRLPIPENSALYLRFTNLAEFWETFTQTKLSNELVSLELWKEPQIQEMFQDLLSANGNPSNETAIPLNKETFMLLFGKQVDMAVYPGSDIPKFVMIMELGAKAKALQIVNRLQQYSGNDQIRTEKYQKTSITLVKVQPPLSEIAYFFVEDYLFFTADIETAHQSLDLMLDGDTKTLLENESFQASVKQIDDFDSFFYVNTEYVQQVINNVSGEESPDISISLADYDHIIAGWRLSDTGLESVTAASLSEDASFKKVMGKYSTIDDLARWIPEKTLLASAGAIRWQDLMESQKTKIVKLGQAHELDIWTEMMKEFHNQFGTDFEEEIRTWAGEGGFFAIQEVNNQDFVPIPETVMGIGVTDSNKVMDFMHRIEGVITAKYSDSHIQFKESLIDDIPFRYIPILGQGLAPGYAVTDDVLFIATSSKGFINALDAFHGKKATLFTTEKFHDAQAESDPEILAFQFIDTSEIMSTLSNLIDNYRLFIPKKLNPDEIQTALKKMALLRSFYTDIRVEEPYVLYHIEIRFS